MLVQYEGNDFDFDLEEITVGQAKVIKERCGLTLGGLEGGLAEGDPDALRALFWLMLQNSGDIRTSIDAVDFKIVKFSKALQDATEKENKRLTEQAAKEKAAGRERKKANPTV
jgi:hypothetical protein